jgi:UDP-N-acetylmuramoyl-L-alanyl-D-glutamate--2,6-diaminopimelate ligase
VTLADLATLAGVHRLGADVAVSGVTSSSTDVRSGDLFAALPGARAHGVTFLDDALARGAVAVLTDDSHVPPDLPVLRCEDPRLVLGPISSTVYGHPSSRLNVVGITGTSGKTTTTFLVRAGLAAVGRPTGLIGTIGTFIGENELPATLTTPEAPQLQALLAVMVDLGVGEVVMEASSHALTLHRVDGTRFRVGVFTNLSQDHLDFHSDMDDYFEAKAKLFDGRSEAAVIVVDDHWGRTLADRIGSRAITVTTRADQDEPATWTARDITVAEDGTLTFTAVGPGVHLAAGVRIPGAYNVANALTALAILAELGVDLTLAGPAIMAAQVPGRMERIEQGQAFLAIVDYSHKPAAVEAALRALRPLTRGRLIIVLGCGGDRDRGKRPLMGAVAARAADVLIVTDDNPRSEVAADIRAAMLIGAREVPDDLRAEVLEVGDRGQAIVAAVRIARTGDTVLIAGKGHETGQDVGGVVHPFDDRIELRTALTS